VLAAAEAASPRAEAALADLCETYWYPVYTFVRRSGHSVDDARDLTQAFFTRLLEKGWLQDVRPDRGRFRAFLLTALRHFLSNERDWRHAAKRGGGHVPLSLEFDDGERRYQVEAVESVTPESLYERRWAQAALDVAMSRLAAHHEAEGRRRLFDRLQPLLTGDDKSVSYTTLAAELNMTEGALRVAVHRLRQRFVLALRETIAETVKSEEDVVDELKYLLDVMRR
jgi:RNA polymerase sigma factor (sigma-70 family)